MKCPECGRNQRRQREGMKCLGCGRNFVLDPKEHQFAGRPLGDGRFWSIWLKATAQQTRYVTENELYTHAGLNATKVRLGNWISGVFVTAIVTGIISLFLAHGVEVDPPILLIAALVGGAVMLISLVAFRVNRESWDRAVKTWIERTGKPENLLLEPGLHQPPPQWPEEDIYDYGVERIILVEREILVDWLVRNGLHLEHKALILAPNGYPDYLTARARQILAEKPDLPVFLLHDDTPEGQKMEANVRATGLLSDRPVIDLGLHPGDSTRLGLPKFLRRGPEDLTVDSLRYDRMTTVMAAALPAQISFAEAVGNTDSSFGAEVDFG